MGAVWLRLHHRIRKVMLEGDRVTDFSLNAAPIKVRFFRAESE